MPAPRAEGAEVEQTEATTPEGRTNAALEAYIAALELVTGAEVEEPGPE